MKGLKQMFSQFRNHAIDLQLNRLISLLWEQFPKLIHHEKNSELNQLTAFCMRNQSNGFCMMSQSVSFCMIVSSILDNVPFSYPLKTPEIQRFSGVFKGYY